MNRAKNRRVYLLLSATGLLVMAGCGSTNHHAGAVGMGMGPAAGYRYHTQTCAPPTDLPGSIVTVTLADMGMSQMMGGTAPMGARMLLTAAPAAVGAGQVTFIVKNLGWRTHELVILPLAGGSPAGRRIAGADGKVDETGSLGEASADCAPGTGTGIPAGSAGWVVLTLPPGRYELVCNLTNHYADGMHKEFTVTSN